MKYKGFSENSSSRYRQIQSRRKFFIWLSIIGAFFLFAIGLTYIVIWSPLSNVHKFEVSGTNFATPPNVLKTAIITETIYKSPWWRNILGPDNIFFWQHDTGHNVASVSYLKSISITTSLFRRSVQVVAEERHAKGVWCISEKQCFVFDQDGVVFAKAPEVHGVLITKVNDESERTLTEHGNVLPYKQWFANMFSTLDTLDNANMTATRVTLSNISLREWDASTSKDLTFRFSLNFVPDNLSKILNDVNERLPISSITYLDFRVPNRLYYR